MEGADDEPASRGEQRNGLLKRGLEALHRVHEKPDAKKVLEFEALAQAFGYSLGVENLHQQEIAVRHGRTQAPARAGRPDSYGKGRERGMKVALPGHKELSITPQHYQRLVRKLSGKPEERIVSYLMLRSLKQARYAPDSLGHFALVRFLKTGASSTGDSRRDERAVA